MPPGLVNTVANLSNRVDALEGAQNNFWIPVVISFGALLASIYALYQNRKQSKASTLQEVKSNINSAKTQVESISMELAPLKAKKQTTADERRELEIKQQVYESVIERLLNAYNDGCDKLYKKQVEFKDFKDLYHQDIRDYVEKFPDKFQEPLTRFDKILQYYRHYHK